MKKTLFIILLLLITACATKDNPDPFETVNRKIYKFNEHVDGAFLKPLAYMYQDLMPDWGKMRVSNALTNLTEPITFINSAIQLDKEHTFTTLGRFVINSTVGLLGTFDVAGSKMGLEHRQEDFGQTFAHYDMGAGAYIVLPFFGPSTARDTGGMFFDWLLDPFTYVNSEAFQIGRTVADSIETRESLLEATEEIEKFSFDPYTTMRSAYIQNRQKAIENR